MANRLTKGKALIGSLDVQGELTINGAPVGSGGSSGTPIPYSMYWDYVNDSMGMYRQSWSIGMGSNFTIREDESLNPNWTQNFLTTNNIQTGDQFDITDVEYLKQTYDMMAMVSSFSWEPAKMSGQLAGFKFYAVAVLDYMSNQPQVQVGYYGNATYHMGNSTIRFNLRKKA